MHEIRCDFHTGFEHKPPRRHPRVRHCQRGVVEHEVVVEQQVEIHRARPPALVPFAIERVLDSSQHAHDVVRGQVGLDQAGAVEKKALARRTSDRFGVAKPAHFDQRDAGHEPQQLQSLIQKITAFADV